jgi:hypothetical protein
MLVAPSRSGFIAPCIPTRAAKPPAGGEIKHDGYRLQVRREGDAVFLTPAPTAVSAGKRLFGGRRSFLMLHGLGAVAAIRLAPTSTGTSIIPPVRVRSSECLTVYNRSDQHRGEYDCHYAHG